MAEQKVDIKNAAKTTALFSLVQIIRLSVGVIRNKFVAVLLGPEGMGIIGLFSTFTTFVKTGACLGLSQSAVRDVSEASGANDMEKFSRVISLTNKLVLFTSVLGLLVTVILSPFFSKWGVGDHSYTLSFIFLSLSVASEVYVENRLAILKGMRRLRSLAKTTIIGSIIGLITGVPIFFFLGNDGIVPSILISSFTGVLVTNYFVNKISYDKLNLSIKEIMHEGAPMLKMGIALMLINFLSSIFDAIITAYLSRSSGVEVLGIFRSGQYLLRQVFGIVLTSMNTDYYPRICAIHFNNQRLQEEVNAQTKLGLLLVFPIAVAFIAFASLLIPLLYSNAFTDIIQYTDIAIIGALFTVPSNCIAMVLLAKQDAKAFTTISLIINVINVGLFIGLYEWCGLVGLGIAYVLNVILQLITYTIVMHKRYQITFSKKIYIINILMLSIVVSSVLIKKINSDYIVYIIETILIVFALIYSLRQLYKMGVSAKDFIKARLTKKK